MVVVSPRCVAVSRPVLEHGFDDLLVDDLSARPWISVFGSFDFYPDLNLPTNSDGYCAERCFVFRRAGVDEMA